MHSYGPKYDASKVSCSLRGVLADPGGAQQARRRGRIHKGSQLLHSERGKLHSLLLYANTPLQANAHAITKNVPAPPKNSLTFLSSGQWWPSCWPGKMEAFPPFPQEHLLKWSLLRRVLKRELGFQARNAEHDKIVWCLGQIISRQKWTRSMCVGAIRH